MTGCRYFPYTLTLKSPAVITALGGDPNSSSTLAYIPGAAVRGAVAKAWAIPARTQPGRKNSRSSSSVERSVISMPTLLRTASGLSPFRYPCGGKRMMRQPTAGWMPSILPPLTGVPRRARNRMNAGRKNNWRRSSKDF